MPSKVIEIIITAPKGFPYNPGDYVFINCQEISSVEWYPFNIFNKTPDGDLLLHVYSNTKWSEKLYSKTMNIIRKDTSLDLDIRIDGSLRRVKQKDFKNTACYNGWSRIWHFTPCSILQDIFLQLKNDQIVFL